MAEWFFTSDLHGQGALYEQLVALVKAEIVHYGKIIRQANIKAE